MAILTLVRHSDVELVERALRRERRAWDDLVRQHQTPIRACIAKVLARRRGYAAQSDIEEVFGDVLLSLVRDDMRKLRLWDPTRGARLGSWLCLLGRNAALDHVRSAGEAARVTALDDAPDVGSGDPSPLEAALHAERRTALERELAGCSAADRELLRRTFGEGLSVQEVADAMGLTIKAVYTRKHRLLARLVAA